MRSGRCSGRCISTQTSCLLISCWGVCSYHMGVARRQTGISMLRCFCCRITLLTQHCRNRTGLLRQGSRRRLRPCGQAGSKRNEQVEKDVMTRDMHGSENRRGHSSTQPGETARTSGTFKNVDEIGSRSPEEIRQLLRKRALVLAEEEHPKADSSNIELLEFVLDGGSYAVESAWVDRIAFVENLTHLPCAPIFIRGVVNLRGEILPVVDLMEFFELRDRKAVNFRSVIVLHSGKM